jgi:hypothetical protein
MSRLLARSGRRFFARHPWQFALAVAGVALGVAVVLGVDLAGASARRAFDASTELVMGRATHQVLPRSGRLDEALYPALRATMRRHGGAQAAAAPSVEGAITLPGGRRVVLLGLDPFVEAPFRDELTAYSAEIDLLALLTTPGAVVLPAALAEDIGAAPGVRLDAVTAVGDVELTVAGVARPDADRSARLGLRVRGHRHGAGAARHGRRAEPHRPHRLARPGRTAGRYAARRRRAGRVRGALAGHLRHDAGLSPEPHRAVAAGAAGRRVPDLQHHELSWWCDARAPSASCAAWAWRAPGWCAPSCPRR